MTPTFQQLGIDQLSVDQRLALIEEIWASLTATQCPIPESHREELDRRLAAADANPGASVPWEEARARLRGKR